MRPRRAMREAWGRRQGNHLPVRRHAWVYSLSGLLTCHHCGGKLHIHIVGPHPRLLLPGAPGREVRAALDLPGRLRGAARAAPHHVRHPGGLPGAAAHRAGGAGDERRGAARAAGAAGDPAGQRPHALRTGRHREGEYLARRGGSIGSWQGCGWRPSWPTCRPPRRRPCPSSATPWTGYCWCRCALRTNGSWLWSPNPPSRRSSHWTVRRDVYLAEVTGVGSASSIPPAALFPAYFPVPQLPAAAPEPPPRQKRPQLSPVLWPEIAARARSASLRDLAVEYGVSHEDNPGDRAAGRQDAPHGVVSRS